MQQNTRFRNDIQGLRGIAVALVVLEHAGGFLSGGFIGVDIFFVISGFVITEHLLQTIQKQDGISMSDFYSRRARRLLPAASLVIVATLLGSLLILSPGLEHSKAASAGLASMFFVPNMRYIFEGGYFFLAADPFRHFWSLGVEEQFYLVYPAFLLILFRISKRNQARFTKYFLRSVVIASLISFAFAALLSLGVRLTPLPTRVGFFGAPFRAWEFLAGAGVSGIGFLSQRRPTRNQSWFIGIFGAALIVWPAITYDAFTLFPGLTALPVVAGTAMLIFSGYTNTAVAQIFCLKPLILLGNISYGLYLWHWPMIVFSERLWPDNQSAVLLSVGLSIAISAIQFRFFENPIRQNEELRGKNALVLLCSTSLLVMVAVVGFVKVSETGLGLSKGSLFDRPFSLGSDCGYESDWQRVLDRCGEEGTSATRVLLLGDSQAAAISDGFIGAAKALNATYSLISANSCPIHARPNELRKQCAEFQDNVKNMISYFRPTVVVVANASDLYVSRGGYGKPDTLIRDSMGKFPKNYHQALENWTNGVRDELRSDWFGSTKIIYVHMSPNPPSIGPSVLKPNLRDVKFRLSSQFDRNEIIAAEKQKLNALVNVLTLDPADTLCRKDICQTQVDAGPIYSDPYHVNSRGAKLLEPALLQALKTQSS